MEKRVRFKSAWLPWLLIAPQMVIVLVFFFWPAAQALYQSLLQEDAFGTSREFVGMANFQRLIDDPSYRNSFKITAIFSALVAVFGISIALLLATMANRVVRGASIYKTLLIWPYAVAPVVAGVLWLMMFASPWGVVSHVLRALGYDWNHLLDARDAMTLIVIAAVWKQISYNFLFFLAGLQSIPNAVIEAASHQRTGYLPVTLASFELTEKSGFYDKNPGADVAVTQMIRKTTDKSRGVRLGNFVQIRTIIDEEMEGVWAGKKTAKEALDAAIKRGNDQLERFQKANRG